MILVVGCGFLGSYLARHISALTDEPILATVRNPQKAIPLKNVEYIAYDLTDADDIEKLIQRTKNEKLTVFYFAACHNIDLVYQNPQKAKEINIAALNNFLNAFDNIEKFFFASTDCVYGENQNGKLLSESSDIRPVNEYGIQKAEAEKIVISNGFTCLRLPFMLGPSLFQDQQHFFDRIKNSLLNEQTVEMIDGLYRNVLSYAQASELIFRLSEYDRKLPAVINVCSDIGLSKYELGCKLAKHFGVSEELIIKISEKDGEKFFKDKRASSSVMDNSLLKSLLGISQIKWEEE